MSDKEVLGFQQSLTMTYQELTSQIAAYFPTLLGALLLLFLGWLLASLLRMLTVKLVRGLDSLFHRMTKNSGIRQDSIQRSYAKISSQIVFWIVMIFFLASTANLLGWRMFSNWMTQVINYLPNLIAGLLIIFSGFLISHITRAAIINTANNAALEQGDLLARIAQIVILFTALVVGIEQIGINVDFLTNVLIVIVGILLAGGALAFGLGAKTLVANIIGAQYVRKHCRIGEQIQLGDVEGSIVEVTQTAIIIDSDVGRAVIPAKLFQEQVAQFTTPVSNKKSSDSSSLTKGVE